MSNLLSIPAKIDKVLPGNSEHYLPIDDVIIMHGNISKAYGLFMVSLVFGEIAPSFSSVEKTSPMVAGVISLDSLMTWPLVG